MGKKGRAPKQKKSSSSAASGLGQDVSKLVEHAQLALDKAEPELALKFFERAHSLNSSDTTIMDSMADVLLQLNEPDRALELLTRSIQLEPNSNPCKYLYLAQLQSCHEALGSYQTGISFLTAEKQGADPEVPLPSLAILFDSLCGQQLSAIDKQLSKAYNGIAELYLTDLWSGGHPTYLSPDLSS
jgi:tetratricopeptide (TPR) repeat protein